MLRMTSVKLAAISLAVLVSTLFIISISAASLAKADIAATISTDKTKYFVGEPMIITGAGFTADGSVTVSVLRPDHVTDTLLAVTADSAGGFTANYAALAIPGRYKISATDGTNSAKTAATEADALKTDFLQCANKNPTLGLCDWISSILQTSDARYFEGMSTLQRLTFDQIPATAGDVHTLSFHVDAQKASIHAYDFLTSWDAAVAAAGQIDTAETLMPPGVLQGARISNPTGANPDPSCDNPSNPQASLQTVCRTLRSSGNANVVTVAMPTITDPSVGGSVDAKRIAYQTHFSDTTGMRLYGNSAITAASLTFEGYTVPASDQEANYTLHWTSASTQLEVEFAAHIAAANDLSIPAPTIPGYGAGLGAASISGGPYHVSMDLMDGSSIGNQDNQLKGADILLPPTTPTVTTQVQNAANANITNTSVSIGTVVHDHAIVDTGSATVLIPAGSTFTFHRYATGDCTGTLTNQTGVAVPSGAQTGAANSSTFTPGVGSFSYLVDFVSGNTATVLSHTGVAGTDCEPFAVFNPTGHIIVDKVTVPSGDSQSFTFTTTGSGYAGFSLTDAASPNDQTLNAGAYSVAESAQSGWTLTNTSCVSSIGDTETASALELDAGETITCTFTNTKKGHIIVDKVTNPAVDPQSFSFTAGGAGYSNFALTDAATPNNQEVVPGAYTVSEGAVAGWSSDGGVCDQGETPASLDVEPGETVTCTFTNTKESHIIVDKATLPSGDPQSFSFTAGGTGYANFSLTDAAAPNNQTLVAGSYSVSETLPSGWTQTSATCVSSKGDSETIGSISLQAGETVTCTFTNTKKGHIVVVKDAVPNNAQDFSFTNDFGNGNPSPFLLDDDSNATLSNTRDSEVLPGTFAVSEAVPSGWKQFSATCSDGSPVNAVNVSAGETVTCTFVNHKLATIVLVKHAVGGNAQFDFSTTGGDGLPASASLTTIGGWATTTFNNIDPDLAYSINETPIPTGWALTASSCTGTNTPASITPNNGEIITCTFTNNKPAAQIDVTPLTDTNKIGDDHVISVNVQVHNGDGSWGPAVNGTVVTFSIVNSIGATATFVGGNTCPTAGGTCTVTINSPTAGHVVVNASVGPVILGVTVTVATGTGGDNSADAQKDYVNARISIAQSDTNEVDDDHVFTVTVEQSVADGIWTPVENAIVDIGIAPAPDSLVETDCADGTNASGQCTATVNSASAGIFTASASANILVNTVAFSLTTDGVGENSDAAVKTYVDAKISLDPLNDTNNVNDPHTVTVTVTKDPGTGPVAAPGEHVDFTLTDSGTTAVLDAGTSTCDDAGPNTDVNGECTIVFTSATPGTVAVHATVTLTVGGVSLTRATDGTHGSTQDANKTYEAGKIIVVKQTLPDGSSQSFTFTPDYNNGTPFDLTDGQQNDSGFIAPGTYSVAEGDVTNWVKTSATCSDGSPVDAIVLGAGEEITCTFTNTENGRWDVHKIVINDNGGTNVATDFSFQVNGDPTLIPFGATSDPLLGATFIPVPPGIYTVTEPAYAGYTTTDNGNCSQVEISAGEIADCTITNNDIPPQLTLNKITSYTHGGTASESSWTLTANGGTAGTLSGPGAAGSTDVVSGATFNAGTYALSESAAPIGYTNGASYSCVKNGGAPVSGNSITLGLGDTATCSITNTDLPAHLIVIKHVINDSGDIATASDFFTTITGVTTAVPTAPGVESPGVDNVLTSVGSYNVDEGTHAGYVETRSADCTGTIDVGQTKTCTITNDDTPQATRTLGFWQTHTTYTSGVFSGFGGTLQIGTKLINTTSRLFAGFYAPISKLSTGGKRLALDQARIQMLQQWLAAKLNCQAFGCGVGTQTLLTNAANAWTSGPASLILSYASQLDTYNNSNDAIPISGQGKATPKDSTTQAASSLSFWDAPLP